MKSIFKSLLLASICLPCSVFSSEPDAIDGYKPDPDTPEPALFSDEAILATCEQVADTRNMPTADKEPFLQQCIDEARRFVTDLQQSRPAHPLP